MKILVIGAGLSGCTAAHVLSTKNHDILIVESDRIAGGLAQTAFTPNLKRIYEPYGNHTFHTFDKDVWMFVRKFGEFRDYVHRKGIIIGNHTFAYPLTMSEMQDYFPRSLMKIIIGELDFAKINPIKEPKNFKEAVISMIGPTLYGIFVENYTRNQWGVEPEALSPKWAPKRIEIRDDDDNRLFRSQYQGVPIHGFTSICNAMLCNDKTTFAHSTNIGPSNLNEMLKRFDIVLCSAPLDEVMYGRPILPYRGSTFIFDFHINSKIDWENHDYGTINFSSGPVLRKINFGIIHGEDEDRPIALQIGSDSGKMYPVYNDESHHSFSVIFHQAIMSNMMPIGRLGAFKYLDMDAAIKTSIEAANLCEIWHSLSIVEKVNAWKNIFEKY